MPDFEQGHVVRVPFPYTDRATRKHRPALVVSAGAIGDGRSLLWVVMITSAENRAWAGDIPLGEAYRSAGLPAPSIIRPCKIATIDAASAEIVGRIDTSILARTLEAVSDCLAVSH